MNSGDTHYRSESFSPAPDKKNEWWEWLKALVIALGLALIIRTFLFAPFVVDGTSMFPNLLDGERLIVNEVIYYIKQPQRGDIIVFHHESGARYIKRVIGIPGDHVEFRNDQLYINGEEQDEPYIREEIKRYQLDGNQWTEDFEEVVVPEGELFVLGDHRPVSDDSRQFGTISVESVIGRADVVFWPLTSFRWLD